MTLNRLLLAAALVWLASPARAGGGERELVLAAVHEFSGPSAARAAESFRGLFPGIKAEDLSRAGGEIEALISEGKISISAGSPVGGGGARWDADMRNGALVGGRFVVSSSLMKLVQCERSRCIPVDSVGYCGRLFQVDRLANNILHEVAHIYAAVLRARLTAEERDTAAPTEFSQPYAIGNADRFCSKDDECRMCGITRGSAKYTWTYKGDHQASAEEAAARKSAVSVCGEKACDGYARIISVL